MVSQIFPFIIPLYTYIRTLMKYTNMPKSYTCELDDIELDLDISVDPYETLRKKVLLKLYLIISGS
jgi:hypothetical protein